MNQHYKPMLAKQAENPFTSEDWIFEVKWDGIRAISYVKDELSIRTRNDIEIKQNFPELEELKNLTHNAVVDGEIVVMKQGKPDFQSLAERSKATSTENIKYLSRTLPTTYILFDLLEKDGKSLLRMPLIQRKKLLQQAVKEGKRVIISAFVEDQGEIYYRAALSKGLEGILAKKKDSQYEPGARTGNWLKIKPLLTCDCIIFGYTIGKGFREHTFGALILGLFDKNGPVYIGKVGTGFSQDTIESMLKTFKPLTVEHATLKNVNVPEEIVWLKPEIVCEIAFQNVTNDNKLRMPRFLRTRTDKAPSECTMDQILHSNLETYAAKRDFKGTPEPAPSLSLASAEAKAFVVQEHHARRLHYDLRLEKDGVLKSWAVPKGMPEQSGDKRLAVETEDHPLEYKSFEGTIPEGHYGAGTVKIFDSGTYEVKTWNDKLVEFRLHGQTLQGRYALARFKKAGEKQWLLLKTKESDQ